MAGWENLFGQIATTILGGLGAGGAIWKFLEYRQGQKKASEDADDKLIGRYENNAARMEAQAARHEAERDKWYERERQLIQTNAEQQYEIKMLTRRLEEMEKRQNHEK